MLGTGTLTVISAIVLGVIVVVIGCTLVIWGIRRRTHSSPLNLDLANVQSVEQASKQILESMASWLPLRTAFAYWRTTDGSRYRVRAALESQPRPGQVGPAYSGLASNAASRTPSVLPAGDIPIHVTVSGTRNDRWIWIPFPNAQFAVRAQLPIGSPLSRAQRRLLDASVTAHTSLIYALGQWLHAEEAARRLRRMAAASRATLDTGTQLEGALELLLKIGGRILGAKLQFALVDGADGRVRISDTEDGLAWADRTLGGGMADLLIIEPQPDLVALGERSTQGLVACARVPIVAGGRALGCFYLLLDSADELSTFEVAALRTLGQRAAQVIAGQQHMREASRSYVSTLDALVQAMDALAPSSIGHADRISRYSRIIAEELALTSREMDDIVLAAKLHDVGMIAVDARLVLKPDQFTVDEFELMKSHAELGSQLLQSLPQGPAVSQMVAAHHERWDGAGYPLGLSGGEIPLGARVIAAAEYFDAKTSGRSYRPPLPYNVALADLRKAAGIALDPQVVDAFGRALETERGNADAQLPPAPCWLLKSVPEHVCAGCANRTQHPTRCWESPQNLCTRHGDRCETCVVYTEAVSRHLVHER